MVKPLKNQGGVLLSTCSVTGTMLGPTGDSKGVATLLCRGTYRLAAQVNQLNSGDGAVSSVGLG